MSLRCAAPAVGGCHGHQQRPLSRLRAVDDDDANWGGMVPYGGRGVTPQDRVLGLLRDLEDAGSEQDVAYRAMEGAFVFEPPSGALPWAVVHFVGGAALGTYPHVAYGEFLARLAKAGVGHHSPPKTKNRVLSFSKREKQKELCAPQRGYYS